MAGVKKRQGEVKPQKQFYLNGEQHRPVLVAVKKLFSDGYAKYISGKGMENQEVVKDQNGRPVPWRSIDWD